MTSSVSTPNCTISPLGNRIVNAGANVAFTFGGSNSNCTVTRLRVDGVERPNNPGNSSYTLFNVLSD